MAHHEPLLGELSLLVLHEVSSSSIRTLYSHKITRTFIIITQKKDFLYSLLSEVKWSPMEISLEMLLDGLYHLEWHILQTLFLKLAMVLAHSPKVFQYIPEESIYSLIP